MHGLATTCWHAPGTAAQTPEGSTGGTAAAAVADGPSLTGRGERWQRGASAEQFENGWGGGRVQRVARIRRVKRLRKPRPRAG